MRAVERLHGKLSSSPWALLLLVLSQLWDADTTGQNLATVRAKARLDNAEYIGKFPFEKRS